MCGTPPSPGPSAPSIPSYLPLYDAHNHPTDHPFPKNLPPHPTHHLSMSTRPSDLPLLSTLATTTPSITPSFAIHPWFTHLICLSSPPPDPSTHYRQVLIPPPPLPSPFDNDPFLSLLPTPIPLSTIESQLSTYLSLHPTAHIGECGLDKSFRLPYPDPTATAATTWTRSGRQLSPYRVSLSHQKAILLSMLRLAAVHNRPVSLHSVAAHGVLFDVISSICPKLTKRQRKEQSRILKSKAYSADFGSDDDNDNDGDNNDDNGSLGYPPAICLHSFSGPPDVAKQYIAANFAMPVYFSFSLAVNLHGGPSRASEEAARRKFAEVLKVTPDDRILAETDMDEVGEDMAGALRGIYAEICTVKGRDVEDGVRKINQNFETYVNLTGSKTKVVFDKY